MVNSTLYNSVFGIQNGGGGRGGKEVAKNVSSLFYEKRELLVKTFANLIFQLGITYYAMEKFSKEDKDGEKDGEKDCMTFKTKRPIRANEEIFDAYINGSMPKAERQLALKTRYGFDCACNKCQSE